MSIGIGGIIGGITQAVGVTNSALNQDRNFASQVEQMLYDRWLQQEMFKREDTAVQRKVNDLTSAGLSPVLASGASASSGPVVKSQAPQAQDIGANIMAMGNFAKTIEDISLSRQQQKLIDAQISTEGTKQTSNLASAGNQSQDALNKKKTREFWNSQGGKPPNWQPSKIGKTYEDLKGEVEKRTKQIGKTMRIRKSHDPNRFNTKPSKTLKEHRKRFPEFYKQQ